MFSIIIYYTGMFRTTEARVAVGSSIVVNWTTWQHTQTGNGFIGWNLAASAQCVTTLSCSGILEWVSLKQILYCQSSVEQKPIFCDLTGARSETGEHLPKQQTITREHWSTGVVWRDLRRQMPGADTTKMLSLTGHKEWMTQAWLTWSHVQLISDTINHIWSFPIFKSNTSDHWSWQVSWSQFKRRLVTWSWISWSQHLSGDCLRTHQWWPGLTRI